MTLRKLKWFTCIKEYIEIQIAHEIMILKPQKCMMNISMKIEEYVI